MKQKNSNVIFADIEKYFLIASTILLTVLFFEFLSPFFSTLIIAGVIAAAAHPLNKWLSAKLGSPSLGSLLTLIIVTVIFLAPFVAFFFFITEEATVAYQLINENIGEFVNTDVRLIPDKLRGSFLGRWYDYLSGFAPISTEDLVSVIRDALERISTLLLGQTTNILKQLSLFLLYIFVFLLSLFYFLRDGRALMDFIKRLVPLPQRHRNELVDKLNRLSKGIIYGFFGAAIAQGFLSGLGFYIAGISNAAFWGTVMAFFSPVPYLGTAIIWVPAVIVLLVQQQWFAALFLLLWSMTIVGTADNIVKPYVIGKTSTIHPLAVLLILLGGVFVFGLKGLVLGPFLLTLLLGFLHIYQLEYRTVLKDR